MIKAYLLPSEKGRHFRKLVTIPPEDLKEFLFSAGIPGATKWDLEGNCLNLWKPVNITLSRKAGAQDSSLEDFLKLKGEGSDPDLSILVDGLDFSQLAFLFERKRRDVGEDLRQRARLMLHEYSCSFPRKEFSKHAEEMALLLKCHPGSVRKWSRADHVVDKKVRYNQAFPETRFSIRILFYLDSEGNPVLSRFVQMAKKRKRSK
jgi:hypothetical protein